MPRNACRTLNGPREGRDDAAERATVDTRFAETPAALPCTVSLSATQGQRAGVLPAAGRQGSPVAHAPWGQCPMAPSVASPRCGLTTRACAAHTSCIVHAHPASVGSAHQARTGLTYSFPDSARVECPGVSLSQAFGMWTNKSDIPQWMPWISSVTVRPARRWWSPSSSAA